MSDEEKLLVPRYTLKELTDFENVGYKLEETARMYLEKVIGGKRMRSLELRQNQNVDTLKNTMKFSACVNLSFQPDVCLYKADTAGLGLLPIVQFEVNSGTNKKTYSQAVKKLTLGLVEQFRLLSNYCDSNLEQVGFVFQSTKDNWVSKVTISWQKSGRIGFLVVQELIPKEHVK